MPSGIALPLPAHRMAAPRAGLLLRLRVRWRALPLARALAAGASPLESRELMLRADQLAQPLARERIARSIARVISQSEDEPGRQVGPSLLPFRRDRVQANRQLLREIGEVLLGPGPHAVRGVAMSSVLLEDGRGPLYANDVPADLARALERILSTLEPRARIDRPRPPGKELQAQAA